MDHFLANVLLALGVAAAPAQTPQYEWFGSTEQFAIEIDMNSFQTSAKVGGWQVKSSMRRVLLVPLAVPGKEKKGAYYLDTTTVRCAQDTFTVDTTSLHAADGEVLAASYTPMTFQNPRSGKNFVTMFLTVVCNDGGKGSKSIMV